MATMGEVLRIHDCSILFFFWGGDAFGDKCTKLYAFITKIHTCYGIFSSAAPLVSIFKHNIAYKALQMTKRRENAESHSESLSRLHLFY